VRLLIVVICLFLSSFALSAIEVEQVEAWSITHPSAQVEDFLDWVKIKDPSQLSWFTLMRKTESSQGATPTDPRAIVFGPTAKFIFTFNGAPTSKGYQEIEMIFFREIPQARWEMRKLSFSPQDKKMFFPVPTLPNVFPAIKILYDLSGINMIFGKGPTARMMMLFQISIMINMQVGVFQKSS